MNTDIEIQKLNTNIEMLQILDKATWLHQHGFFNLAKTVGMSDGVAEQIVDFILTNTDHPVVQKYLEVTESN